MSLGDAIYQFFQEFNRFETQSVGMAFRSLSSDQALIDRAQSHLPLNARLTLLRRLAMARDPNAGAVSQLDAVIKASEHLVKKKDELSRNAVAEYVGASRKALAHNELQAGKVPAPLRVWVPTSMEIEDCNVEMNKLQLTLHAVSQHFSVAARGIPDDNG